MEEVLLAGLGQILFLQPYQTLEKVRYFSAIQKNKEKAKRQDLLFQANKFNPKFSITLGNFRQKSKWRNVECNGKKVGREIKFWEEKKSDVALASFIIRDIIKEECDTIFLFSADSDITPALDVVKEITYGKRSIKIIVFFPPGNFSYDLKDAANKAIKLENHEYKFKASLLPKELTLQNGYVIKCPEKWN